MQVSLRNFRDDDFDAFHRVVSDYDVVKMTSSWPYPAEEDFTRMRMNTPEARSGVVRVVEVDGELAGVVGIVHGEVGYHIGKPFWGRGVMTTALRLRLDEEFTKPGVDLLKSCVWEDNPASARVLEKCGFEFSRMCSDYCKARDAKVGAIHYELTRERWHSLSTDA